jgi:hypothetical protein
MIIRETFNALQKYAKIKCHPEMRRTGKLIGESRNGIKVFKKQFDSCYWITSFDSDGQKIKHIIKGAAKESTDWSGKYLEIATKIQNYAKNTTTYIQKRTKHSTQIFNARTFEENRSKSYWLKDIFFKKTLPNKNLEGSMIFYEPGRKNTVTIANGKKTSIVSEYKDSKARELFN